MAKKVVYYRRSRISPESDHALQQLVSTALASLTKIKERLEPTDASAKEYRVINSFRVVDGFLCGSVLTFQRGSYQLVIMEDPEATSLKLTALAPPAGSSGLQQQYVPGVLYFAIFGNHVLVAQSAALRASSFEQHLAWLLRMTQLITNEQGLVLADEPKHATKQEIKNSHVKSMMFGRPFMNDVGLAGIDVGAPKSVQMETARMSPDPSVLSLLKGFLGDDFSKLGLENAVFEGNLEVWIEVRYPRMSRSHPADSIQLLDNLAIALRDQDPDSVQLKLQNGFIVNGADLKISKTLDVATSSGMVSEDDMYQGMVKWLTQMLKDGMVTD